jgi:crotonobetainyl-CoA:carnitine CoA-transferase CaiB-like acyl-CoA transferase
MQAEAGYLSLTGEPDGPPARMGLSMVDFMTGTIMTIGLLSALIEAKETGQGRDVDVDLLSAAVHQLSYPAVWYLNEGDVTCRTPRSAHPSVTPSQMFRTADGWMFVMAQLPKFWTILCNGIGRPDLIDDSRFASPEARLANRGELTTVLDGIFSQAPTRHWLDLLEGQMPVAPVFDVAEALDNPFLQTNRMLDSVAHPDRPELRVLANPIRLDGERLPNRAGPLLGADTDAVLAESGLGDDEIAALRATGTI